MEETCTNGLHPASLPVSSTVRVPTALSRSIEARSRRLKEYVAAACTTESQPSTAALTDAGSVMSPCATSMRLSLGVQPEWPQRRCESCRGADEGADAMARVEQVLHGVHSEESGGAGEEDGGHVAQSGPSAQE